MTKVIIAGAKGKMGQALLRVAGTIPQLSVVASIDVGDDFTTVIDTADVLVDFTSPEATLGFARICAQRGKALVIGTTGHDAKERGEILKACAKIPVVWSANYSTGVNALFWLTGKAAEILGPGYDLEVVEMHHRMKKDAPSGTARTLGEILAKARQEQFEKVARHGRDGIVGARTSSEIGMHSMRGGDVVGDHTVIFATNGERLELTHKASSRDTFAGGALRAALWVAGKAPGVYDMQDVLGLK